MATAQKELLERLLTVTENCRLDMHEPDEQGLSAVVAGYRLDNAMGHDPFSNCGEFTVGLSLDDGVSYEWFNLADLIALARMDRPLKKKDDSFYYKAEWLSDEEVYKRTVIKAKSITDAMKTIDNMGSYGEVKIKKLNFTGTQSDLAFALQDSEKALEIGWTE